MQMGVWTTTIASTNTEGRGGGMFRAGENMNLQILEQQNLCHSLKMSEQIKWGSQ